MRVKIDCFFHLPKVVKIGQNWSAESRHHHFVIVCVGGCHGVMVSTPGPTSRRRQLPAVPAGPEWHNTAASATPCATLREPPSPFPALLLSTPHGIGSYRADHTAGAPCRSLCTQGPQCIQCVGGGGGGHTRTLPLHLARVLNNLFRSAVPGHTPALKRHSFEAPYIKCHAT